MSDDSGRIIPENAVFGIPEDDILFTDEGEKDGTYLVGVSDYHGNVIHARLTLTEVAKMYPEQFEAARKISSATYGPASEGREPLFDGRVPDALAIMVSAMKGEM